MKTTVIKLFFVVALFLSLNNIQALTTAPQLNQKELIKQLFGKWQAPSGKDSLELWDWQPYGKSYKCEIQQVIKGQNKPWQINTSYFDSKTSKFFGAAVSPNGWAWGWNGAFVTEKKLVIDVYNLKEPSVITTKIEFVFNTNDSFTGTYTPTSGKVSILNFSRIK